MPMVFDDIYIDIRKLRDYCLNSQHPVGKHKARVFSSQLGIVRGDAGLLKEAISEKIKHAVAELVREMIMENGFALISNWRLKTDRQTFVRYGWSGPEAGLPNLLLAI
jgi:hypothetical protein